LRKILVVTIIAPIYSVAPYRDETKYWTGMAEGKVALVDFKSQDVIEEIETEFYRNLF